jgi:hypothetical protein
MISHVCNAAELSALGSSLVVNIKAVNCNTRYNNPDDGDHAWPNRKEMVVNVVNFYGADLVGMQKVLRGKLTVLETLQPDHTWYGVGRDNGLTVVATTLGKKAGDTGEFASSFYCQDRSQPLDSTEYWLFETPDLIASRDGDAALLYITSSAKFKGDSLGKT